MTNKKFFPADKNYLLKEAQANSEVSLRSDLMQMVKKLYMAQFNSLGLEDDFIVSLKNADLPNDSFLAKPYAVLAALYRYQYGDNQLEFLWDGSSHVSHYEAEWKSKYESWLVDMCLKKPSFTRALIKFIFDSESEMNTIFIEKYLCNSILDHFGFKLYKKDGLTPARRA